MKIGVIGAGPGGLYFALLAKLADPSRSVIVYERNPPKQTYGWGVVLSEDTLATLATQDPVSCARLGEHTVMWDAIDTHFKQEQIRCRGHRFAGLERRRMLCVLAKRCEELGVELRYNNPVSSARELALSHDLVVAADGIRSATRQELSAQLCPAIHDGSMQYIWLGCDRAFEHFSFFFQELPQGMLQAHAYPYAPGKSTFIVECAQDTWEAMAFDRMPIREAIDDLELRFVKALQGAELLSNQSRWQRFSKVTTQRWHHENIVLLGDAAHTLHFSIGSGTKMAIDDAIALCQALDSLSPNPSPAQVSDALTQYQDARWVDAAKLQKSATTSQRWFEASHRYRQLDPLTFSAHLLTRSKRITRDNLHQRDPDFVRRWDHRFAKDAGRELAAEQAPPPPMFTPFRIGGIEVANRVVVSPMCQYAAEDGVPGDWHFAHLGALARGGAGLVIAEMTAISPEARITRGCTGLYNETQVKAWSKILDFARSCGNARFGVQLGHAGRKGACTLPHKGDASLGADGWPLIAPSALPFDAKKATPRAFDHADIKALVKAYTQATQRALRAGFDLLELHMAHGYLLGSCLSPLTNQRADDFGGSLQGRARLPLLIFDTVRRIWPRDRALSVRISATDWAEGGFSQQDRLALAQMLKARGCDILDVSTGQTVETQKPEYGRFYQTRFSDEIRHEVGIPTIAVGAITTWDQINTIVASGRADLCALGRPHLLDPHFTLRAAIEQGHPLTGWPTPYQTIAPGGTLA